MEPSEQTTETVPMPDGARQRSARSRGFLTMRSIGQGELKRTIQISDSARKYVVAPMERGDSTGPAAGTSVPAGPAEPSRRGGVVTYTTSSIDTGERKEMFGFTARHIKSSTEIDSSPDACNPTKQRIERDGWYRSEERRVGKEGSKMRSAAH